MPSPASTPPANYSLMKKYKNTVVTGRQVCLVAGIIAAVCGFYWLVRALAYDDTNLFALLSSIVISLFLTLSAGKR